jgi:hypothetical protein
VTGIELVPAVVFAALAVRSAVYWFRHRMESRDATDDLLFAAFVTGRVGSWLAAACMFAPFGTIDAQGRAFADEAGRYSWLFILFLALGAMQLLAAWFLSTRGAKDTDETPTTLEAGDEPRPPA